MITLFQAQTEKEKCILQLFRKLIQLRKKPSFQKGSLQFNIVNEEIFSFVRYLEGSDVTYLVALNVGKSVRSCDFSQTGIMGNVVLVSCEADRDFNEGERVDLTKVTLKPGDGLVLC